MLCLSFSRLYCRNVGKHCVKDRTVILLFIALNIRIKLNPHIFAVMRRNTKLHINRLLCRHGRADCRKRPALIVRVYKVVNAVAVKRYHILCCAEKSAARLVGIKHVNPHIRINLKKTDTACNKVDKMVHCFGFFLQGLALFFRFSDVGKGNFAQRIILIIPCSSMNKIILRGIIHQVNIKIYVRRILLADFFHYILPVTRLHQIKQ